ncbi:protein Skeletor, isoforms B/C [Ixodes scapularis]
MFLTGVGTVAPPSNTTLFLTPDAHFIVGTKDQPDASGLNVPDEKGSWAKLRRYTRESIIITLPNNTKINGFKYLAVFDRSAGASFGHITIPTNFETPKPVTVGRLRGQDGKESGPVVLVDSRTMFIVHFSYAAKVDLGRRSGRSVKQLGHGAAVDGGSLAGMADDGKASEAAMA